MKYIGIIVTLIIASIIGIVWQSYLYQTAINWFLTDLGFVLLSKKVVAAGLIFIRFMTYQHLDLDKSNKDIATKFGESFAVAFINPLFMFCIVYCIHRFM